MLLFVWYCLIQLTNAVLVMFVPSAQDYSIPRIDLFTEPQGMGRKLTFQDDAIEVRAFGIPQSTASIKVHSGT